MAKAKKKPTTAPQKKSSGPSTQKYLDIAEIRDNIVILKDGTMRSVVMVSSINFALKSEEEQNAIVQGYMQFLNALTYPLQIVIQSRKLNIDNYMNQLATQLKKQENELLKNQIVGYRDFVKELIEIGEIMTKKFFVVIPYSPLAEGKRKSFYERFREVFTPGAVIKVSRKKFIRYTQELNLRVSQVQGSLNSLGLKSVVLDTQSLMELYYNTYNPSTAMTQQLANINELQVEGF